LRRDHGPLANIQVPTMKIHTDDKGQRRFTIIGLISGTHLGGQARASAIASIQNHSVKKDDGLTQAIDPNVLDKFAELNPLKERKDVREGMEWDVIRHDGESLLNSDFLRLDARCGSGSPRAAEIYTPLPLCPSIRANRESIWMTLAEPDGFCAIEPEIRESKLA
jgi:hypothetical protein